MNQKTSILILLELITILTGITALIIMDIPIYQDTFRINYQSSIGTMLTISSSLGFIGILLFIINIILNKSKYYLERIALLIIFFITLIPQY